MIHNIELAIVEALKNTISTYPDEAPESATYPYAVISGRRLTIEDNISNWIIEVNVWDKNKYNSRAEAKADAIEKVLDYCKITLADGSMARFFKANRNDILDTDETIKRVKVDFSTTIYENESEA